MSRTRRHRRRGTRRRQDPRQDPRRATATPVYPSAAALLAQRPSIRAVVIACEIPATEIDDVTSTCLVAAWAAIQRGELRVYAGVDPAMALRRWVEGIAWRLSLHERERAHHRREVLTRDPWAHVAAPPAFDVECQVAAREALRLVRALPPKRQALLLWVAAGRAVRVLALRRGITERAVRLQIAQARGELREQMGALCARLESRDTAARVR